MSSAESLQRQEPKTRQDRIAHNCRLSLQILEEVQRCNELTLCTCRMVYNLDVRFAVLRIFGRTVPLTGCRFSTKLPATAWQIGTVEGNFSSMTAAMHGSITSPSCTLLLISSSRSSKSIAAVAGYQLTTGLFILLMITDLTKHRRTDTSNTWTL